MTVSPYELLRSCIPRPAETVVTPYDLYSAVQAQQGEPSASAAPMREPDEPPHAEPPLPHPARRTHYIADIRARHELAQRQPTFSPRG